MSDSLNTIFFLCFYRLKKIIRKQPAWRDSKYIYTSTFYIPFSSFKLYSKYTRGASCYSNFSLVHIDNIDATFSLSVLTIYHTVHKFKLYNSEVFIYSVYSESFATITSVNFRIVQSPSLDITLTIISSIPSSQHQTSTLMSLD